MNENSLAKEITLITNVTRDVLLKENPDSLVLYMFYIQGANYQETNSVWHQDIYVRKGLKWGSKRFSLAKEVLLRHDLIETFKTRKEDGTFGKTYIRIKHLFKEETKKTLLYQQSNHNTQKPALDEPRAESQNTNALSNYNLNALSNLKLNAYPDKSGDSLKPPSIAIKYVARFNELYRCKQTLTQARMKTYKARVKSFGEDNILIALENMAADPFYRGENNRGWVPDISWLIRSDDNVNKFLSPAKPIKKSLEERLKEEYPDAEIW